MSPLGADLGDCVNYAETLDFNSSFVKSERGFPGGSVVKNPPALQETQVLSLVGKMPWRRAWQPTPVFLPGESDGQKGLAGYSPQDLRVRHNCSNLAYTCTQNQSIFKFIIF